MGLALTTFHAEVTVDSQAALEAFAASLAPALRAGGLVLLQGPLGAGKTTMAKALGRALGVTEGMTSPTFDLMHVHAASQGTVYHLDGYRLQQPDEWDVLDLPAAGEDGVLILAEWGDALKALYPERLEIRLAMVNPGAPGRRVEVEARGALWAARVKRQLEAWSDGI